MFNINYMLAKALQRDQLRNARNNRLSRLLDMRRKPGVSYVPKKAKR